MQNNRHLEIEEIEIQLLLDAIYSYYGYDFRHYALASLKRRIRKALHNSGLKHISEMIPRILYERSFFESFFLALTVNLTEMFRDPSFFKALREKAINYLRTYPFLRIWVAGCSTGEEVYSLAILLFEEGLYKRSMIYATDYNDYALEKARQGIYPAKEMQKHTRNYQHAGGKTSFADYYHADYDAVIMNRYLKENIVFANHNLATDEVFGEMNLILCRNVLIYFDKVLQDRVLDLLQRSLCYNGLLCLGTKESLQCCKAEDHFKPFMAGENIYQKRLKTA